ncbi:histone RNA hairpin-binding protein-like isoform X3 [Hydractinia symbiolongicarpus]|uniref:histone RNA hairpin-binding protein-like isoform X3 n=1 Tax=Hydractinia symbiolongicarpus TaxID=13093 RepID=UPI002551158B|nr:histone RNA hairpin-binding protein-like isoform X3 [Hydractinia symbiolongicarpus]
MSDNYNSSRHKTGDKKRKQEYAGDSRKKSSRGNKYSYNIDEYPELKYTVEHFESYTSYTPKNSSPSSSASKSWGDIMEDEDRRQNERSRSQGNRSEARRKMPLSEVNSNQFPKRYEHVKSRAIAKPIETDEKRLSTRQRQIDIGKNTEGYRKYVAEVTRRERTKDHPWTPNKFTVCSTRSWSGIMRIWRRKLHFWDPPSLVAQNENSFCNIPSSPVDDVFQKRHIDDSMETDDCHSENSSQTSSNEDSQRGYHDGLANIPEEEFLFGKYEFAENENFNIHVA